MNVVNPSRWFRIIERHGLPVVATVALAVFLAWYIHEDRKEAKVSQRALMELVEQQQQRFDRRLENFEENLEEAADQIEEVADQFTEADFCTRFASRPQ